MYYNIAVSTMVVKLQLKENIKHAIICTITYNVQVKSIKLNMILVTVA